MLTKRIIPCLDVKDGRVVKGINFVQLRDAGDPVETGEAYSKLGADELVFLDITATSDVVLDDLIGYELQKEKLIANTEAFVSGRAANNVLLYGDAGTGKSTSIKAILNQYYDRGLRMIEVYKHEFRYLQRILAEVKNRNYRFILYMDARERPDLRDLQPPSPDPRDLVRPRGPRR